MTNQKERRKVPELRFPEFSEEWEEKKLSDSIQLLKSGLSRQLSNEDIGYPVIRANNLQNGKLDLTDLKFWFKDDPQGANTENYFVEKNDILINFINSESKMGTSCIINEPLYRKMIYTTNILRYVTKKGFHPYFHYTYTFTSNYKKWIKIITKPAVNQASFTTVDFKNIPYLVPSFNEQQKIGEFFSKLDRQIELEEKKLALLEEQKKGYMQKIFSQELRFKDDNGEDYPEWEDLRLGDIFQEVNDKTSINNEYPILSSTNNGLFSQKDYFKHQVASTNNIGYKILKKNQVVLSPQNLWLGNININFKFEEGIVSPSYKIFNIINSNPLFISYILKRPKMLFEYKNASEQGASIVRRNLNLDLFYNIKLRLPSYEEQTSIQNFLSVIENQIDRSDYKIKMLNLRKNYLLNKIFM